MVTQLLVPVNTLAYGCGMEDRQRLDKVAWINAGFRALCVNGPSALKAEPLARELGVSKGSFYWHFTNLGAFRQAMIDHWVAVATRGIIETVEASGESAQMRLATLVELSTAPPPVEVGGKGAEGAIRCWGRADASVGERLRAVDAARLEYCRKLFKELGFSAKIARQRGRLLYAALIGLEQLDQSGLASARIDLQALLKLLVVNPSVA